MSFLVSDASSDDSQGSPVESYMFGCELSSKTTYYTFQVDEEDDCEHNLSLCSISLGEGVRDEYNVVEVTARNHINEDISVPIATLKLSCQTMVNLDNFVIQPPVTFRLKSGSGPVLLSGQVIVVPPYMDSEEEEEEDDEDDSDDEEEKEDLVPIKPANKKLRK
ncbi:PREDICTED: nucleoplasmin-like protein NO29 [Nanorana parkeri]|uniref:nucleoplasmin-like protein NO29 n=1 Tax=Nanorana parkeri TaxID=125878 RepID=UPI000854A0EA|nr:PREDICTED: nucleoplasmin-like protein NO29 [Nanorana parkeri]